MSEKVCFYENVCQPQEAKMVCSNLTNVKNVKNLTIEIHVGKLFLTQNKNSRTSIVDGYVKRVTSISPILVGTTVAD